MSRIVALFSILSLICIGIAAGGEVIPLDAASSGVRLDVLEGGAEMLVVSLSELRLDAIDIDGRSWAVVRVPGGHNLMDRGLPSLPYLATEYLLQATGGIEVELVSVQERTIDLTSRGFAGVAPSKGHFGRDVDPDTVPWIFEDKVYSGNTAYPADAAIVDEPFIAGPLRGQALRFPVARWQADSNELTVVEEARFVVVQRTHASNPRLRAQPPLTGLHDRLARQRAVNYPQMRARFPSFVEIGRLLILADDDFIDEVAPLAAWQTRVGYPTVVTPTSTSGTTANQIKAFIQGLYDEPAGLSWVVLVGDSPQIPTLTGVNSQQSPCDACYTKLEGADNRPDAAISRISAQSGDQVAAQVTKILDYERYPDVGSAAAWYTKGFGIGSDDTGGTGLADWERIELLRDDLMEPAYSYTEFDQIYHSSATAAQVTAAVENGRSLGLYIGHGDDASWGTTGFDTGNANALVNGEMLPVIWSVACNNGEFTVNECFGEAWLRNPSGGAVSFEGGTTTESWVPPCDAQRGIVDALRLETAFTTGGQHMAGKQYVMDVNGDSNSSEGNKWVEQSALFGACTTWMRTVEATAPDEPLDFTSVGGVASLTVMVGGQPYALADGAMVSFYVEDGPGIDVLGSGLIDASGVVNAPVSGDPTHCHIHGHNLIPQSFELAARPDGRVSLDAGAYGCSSTVGIRVSDSNVPGATPSTVDTVEVMLAVPGEHIPLTLTETGVDRNIFAGSAELGTELAVAHGQTLTVTYVDADDGAGGSDIPRTAEAAIDCAGPEITSGPGLTEMGSTSAVVEWTTDEPGTSVAELSPGGLVFDDDLLVDLHQLELTGLTSCTEYTVTVASTDALGNPGVPVASSPFTTWQLTVALDDDIESGLGGFSVDTAIDPPGGGVNWTIVATGSHSPSHSWFSEDEAAVKDDRLVIGPYDLGGGTTTLGFWHHYDLETGWDGAVVEVSTDGTTWLDVIEVGSYLEGGYDSQIPDGWDNPLSEREAWSGDSGGFVRTVADLSSLAGSQVWVRFRLGCDNIVGDVGWWVDDVVLETTQPCTLEEIFGDGFDTGDCTAWSRMVD